MSAQKAKGTRWESACVAWLRDNGVPHAERRALAGAKDRGDIAGVVNVCWELKAAARLELAAWLEEAKAEAANDSSDIYAVWAKRRGKASPADGYVITDGSTWLRLLVEAGYIRGPE